MKRTELDRAYTAKVAEYISKGYIIYTDTMSGHQGEIAKIDLIKDSDLIRIYCDVEHDAFDEFDSFRIAVGRVPENYNKSTIWTDELETIEKQEFIQINDCGQPEWYVTKEEFEEKRIAEIVNFRMQCENNNHSQHSFKFDSKYNNIVISFIRRQPKFKTVKLNNIEVYKFINYYGQVKYSVMVNGQKFDLK